MGELSRVPDVLMQVHLPENPLSPAFEESEAHLFFFFFWKIVQNLLGNTVLEMLITGEVNPTFALTVLS